MGHYSKLEADSPGYLPARSAVTVGKGSARLDFTARRDWAATSGGATVADFTGTDHTAGGCGPAAALDLSQVSGWKTAAAADEVTPSNVFVPKHLTVKLPQTINLKEFGVDPPPRASTAAAPRPPATGSRPHRTAPRGPRQTRARSLPGTEDG